MFFSLPTPYFLLQKLVSVQKFYKTQRVIVDHKLQSTAMCSRERSQSTKYFCCTK